METILKSIDAARKRLFRQEFALRLCRFVLIAAILSALLGVGDFSISYLLPNLVRTAIYRWSLFLLWACPIALISAYSVLALSRCNFSRRSVAEKFVGQQPEPFDGRYLLAAVDFAEHPPERPSPLVESVIQLADKTDFSIDVTDSRAKTRRLLISATILLPVLAVCLVFPDNVRTALARVLLPWSPAAWRQLFPDDANAKISRNPPGCDTSDSGAIRKQDDTTDKTGQLPERESIEQFRRFLRQVRDELARGARMQKQNRELTASISSEKLDSAVFWQGEVRKLLTDPQSGIPHYYAALKSAVAANQVREKLLLDISEGIDKLDSEQLVPLDILFNEWKRLYSTAENGDEIIPGRDVHDLRTEIIERQDVVFKGMESLLELTAAWDRDDRLNQRWGELFGKQLQLYDRSIRELSETAGLNVYSLTPGRQKLLLEMNNRQRQLADDPLLADELHADIRKFMSNSASNIETNRLGRSIESQREIIAFMSKYSEYVPRQLEFMVDIQHMITTKTPGSLRPEIGESTGTGSPGETVAIDDPLRNGKPGENPAIIPPGGENPIDSGDPGSGTGGNPGDSAPTAVVLAPGKMYDIYRLWGELPERIKGGWNEPPKEEPLPQYREATEEYYRRLIELWASERKSSSESKN